MNFNQYVRLHIKVLSFSCVQLGLLFFLVSVARAAPAILDVRDIDTPGAVSVLHVGGLTDSVSGFVDRVGQDWINIPASLEGADYIQSAQNNADVSDDRGTSLLIEVDVTQGTVLYMFIHDDQPVTPFPWMNAADFGADWVDTGLDIFWTIDDSTFDIWRTAGSLDAGTYNFRQMPTDSSFYGIAATNDIGGIAGEVVIFGAAHIGPEGDSTLHHIHPNSGIATPVGTGIGFQRVSGMDFDPASGVLYATGEREAGDLDVNVLMTINVSTGVGTEIGPTGVVDFEGAFSGDPFFEGVFTDLSFRPTDHTLFGFSYPGHWVATIDLATGVATQQGFENFVGERGLDSLGGDAITFLIGDTLLHAGGEGFVNSPDDCCPPTLERIDLFTNMATRLSVIDYPDQSPLEFPRANAMDFFGGSEEVFASVNFGFGGEGRATFLGTIQATGDVSFIGETQTGIDALATIASVNIDIKPKSKDNEIELDDEKVNVAILGSNDLDAVQVATSTIRFGPSEAAAEKCKIRDTNKDGALDLMCKFDVRETGIACGDTDATLYGATFGGEPIIGTDAVSTIKCIVNGTFEIGDLTGWTASGINNGIAVVNQEETCFSFNNTQGLTFNGNFAANVRSSGPAPTNSIGILTSAPFVTGSQPMARATAPRKRHLSLCRMTRTA